MSDVSLLTVLAQARQVFFIETAKIHQMDAVHPRARGKYRQTDRTRNYSVTQYFQSLYFPLEGA